MNIFPHFNKDDDLPVDIYQATLQEVLDHFGPGSLQRQLVAQRLVRIYNLAKGTGLLARFVIYGSFVTSKPNPGDVDVFLLMEESFDPDKVYGAAAVIFNHMLVHEKEGVSVFWSVRGLIIGDEQTLIEGWQEKRGNKTRRGIVEITGDD